MKADFKVPVKVCKSVFNPREISIFVLKSDLENVYLNTYYSSFNYN